MKKKSVLIVILVLALIVAVTSCGGNKTSQSSSAEKEKKENNTKADNKGNTIVYPKYAKVEDFKNSRAAVMSDGKWGFIDNSGKEVIPLKYDSASSFITNSYAGTFTMVTLNGERFFIDENGASIKFS